MKLPNNFQARLFIVILCNWNAMLFVLDADEFM